MADTPKRLWLWPAEPEDGVNKSVSFPNQPYPSGSTEYIRADVARTDAEMAVAEAIRRAAEEAASEGWPDGKRIGVSERDEAAMDCANRIETAILAISPADALAEVQRLREERDAALAQMKKLRHLITEASDPDFIWGALDNVHDMDVTLDDYAAAVSRAIRAALDEDLTDASS